MVLSTPLHTLPLNPFRTTVALGQQRPLPRYHHSNFLNRASRAATADVTILLAVKTLVWLDNPIGHLRFGNNNVAACIRGDQSIYMLIVRVPPFNLPGLENLLWAVESDC